MHRHGVAAEAHGRAEVGAHGVQGAGCVRKRHGVGPLQLQGRRAWRTRARGGRHSCAAGRSRGRGRRCRRGGTAHPGARPADLAQPRVARALILAQHRCAPVRHGEPLGHHGDGLGQRGDGAGVRHHVRLRDGERARAHGDAVPQELHTDVSLRTGRGMDINDVGGGAEARTAPLEGRTGGRRRRTAGVLRCPASRQVFHDGSTPPAPLRLIRSWWSTARTSAHASVGARVRPLLVKSAPSMVFVPSFKRARRTPPLTVSARGRFFRVASEAPKASTQAKSSDAVAPCGCASLWSALSRAAGPVPPGGMGVSAAMARRPAATTPGVPRCA